MKTLTRSSRKLPALVLGCTFAILACIAACTSEPRNPGGIVSFSPAMSETVYALGEGERLTGVTQFCSWPPELARAREEGRVAVVGDLFNPSVEKVLRLQPGLILAERNNHSDKLDRLRHSGASFFEIRLQTLDDIRGMILALGTSLGREKEAARLANDIDSALASAIGEPAPRVLLVYPEYEPASIEAVGRDSYQSEILERLGARNAIADDRGVTPKLGAEHVLELDPDLIIELSYVETTQPPLDRWRGLPVLRAVKTGEVHQIAGRAAVSMGPQTVELIKALHAQLKAWQARETARRK